MKKIIIPLVLLCILVGCGSQVNIPEEFPEELKTGIIEGAVVENARVIEEENGPGYAVSVASDKPFKNIAEYYQDLYKNEEEYMYLEEGEIFIITYKKDGKEILITASKSETDISKTEIISLMSSETESEIESEKGPGTESEKGTENTKE